MPFNGSGTFQRLYSWVADKAAGIDITASRFDADEDDIVANGLSDCLTRDGQGVPTTDLPMATFRHIDVGDGVARTDYASLGQVQDGVIFWAAAGGSDNALTATYSPAVTALRDGQLFGVRANSANSSTTPTFSPNGLGPYDITMTGGNPVTEGLWAQTQELLFRYNLVNTRFEMLNPPESAGSQSFSGGTLIDTLTMDACAIDEAYTTIASASTVSIGVAAANYLQVTGTETIEAFDTAQAGIERTLEFIGALTLTYNATSLILPGAANIETAAGDTAIFRSEGSGNWRCIAYQTAAGPVKIANNDMMANTSGSSAVPVGTALSAFIDSAIGSTRGAILERGSSGWALIDPGPSGDVFTSNGTGADPSYQTVSLLATYGGVGSYTGAYAVAQSTQTGGYTLSDTYTLSGYSGEWRCMGQIISAIHHTEACCPTTYDNGFLFQRIS